MPAARRALVVVDVQQEYFAGPLAIQYPPVNQALGNILDALDVATREGIPVAIVQHEKPEGAALFAKGSPGWALHPGIEGLLDPAWKRMAKTYASCFDDTELAGWLRQHEVDTVTLVGFMTNNCILATAAAAVPLGFTAEVLSDATGAIHLANDAGAVSARQLHDTLLVLLNSNFAAVATTADWAVAAADRTPLPGSNLRASATEGHLLHAG